MTQSCSLLPTTPGSSGGAVPGAIHSNSRNILSPLPFLFSPSRAAGASLPALFAGAKSTPDHGRRRLPVPAGPSTCPGSAERSGVRL